MEDFEKIKNEESQNKTKENVVNQDNTNVSNSSTNNKKKNNKVLKISLGSVAAVVLVGAGIFVGTKLIGDKTLTIDNNGTQNSSLTAENNVQTIDEQKLEEGIKNTLIKLAQKETSSMKSGNNAYAEGHVLLKSEIKNKL